MAEKHTERITQNYITKLLNINEYNTNGNKELFNNKIPDGWLLKDNNLLIIENKPEQKQYNEGLKQLLKYCKIVTENNNEKYNIYCILSIGITEEDHVLNYFKYNEQHFNKVKENMIKNIFSNVVKTYNCQSIHNILVQNFHFDKAEELHDIITIIISSFTNDELVKYYKLNDEMVTKDFIILLTENAKELLGNGYNKYLKVIQETEFRNAFKICKIIYSAYRNDSHIISNLFQQFKKYNSYTLSKNEIWTEPEICKIMFNELNQIIKNNLHKNNNDELTICDPCIGGGNLLMKFMKNYNNLYIKGCDTNKHLLMNNKLELIIKGYNVDNIYCNDYHDIDNKRLLSDITICNPPYSKNISKHNCLEFVNKSLEHSQYCCYIIPKNKFITEKKEFKKLITNHTILKIINIGEIFKTVSTGDIIIFTASKDKLDVKTKYIDLSEISKEYIKIIRHDEYTFTERGLILLNDLYNNNLKTIEYIPTIKQPYPNDLNSSLLNNIKSNIVNSYENGLKTLFSVYVNNERKEIIMNEIINQINDINKCNSVEEILMLSSNNNALNKIKLIDYFELVKFKPITLSKIENGLYPIYGSSKEDEPIKYINTYTIDTNGENWIQLNKDGSAGYCFIRNGKFSMNSHCLLLKVKNNYKDVINLDDNINILSLQISNMGFGFDKAINNDRLNNIEVYLHFSNSYIVDRKINYITFKLSERFNVVNKKANYKYSTQGKESGNIPLFACKKLDNGIAKHVDKEEYEGDVIIVVHHRDATCGYSFHYNGKLAWNQSCYVIEPKEEFKGIDMDYIAKYLTLTISPNHLESEHFNKEYLMNFVIEYPTNR